VKWTLLFVGLISLPVFAAKQYTEAECILIKQQVADYKRSLGAKSGFYAQAKASFDSHCQNPVKPKRITNQKTTSQTIKFTAENLNAYGRTEAVASRSKPTLDPPSIASTAIKPLMPAFILLVLCFLFVSYFRRNLPQIKGRIGENYVIKGLTKYLDASEYTIINDVTLPLTDGGTTQVDHVVISRFGIFVIETKNMTGWIFGNEKQARWTQTIHRSKHYFQNPLRQNYKHTKTLAELLDLPHEIFYSVIVFTPNAELKTAMPENVGHRDEMLAYIKSFEQEVIAYKLKLRVAKLIDVIRLKQGYETNKKHVAYLKGQQDKNLVI